MNARCSVGLFHVMAVDDIKNSAIKITLYDYHSSTKNLLFQVYTTFSIIFYNYSLPNIFGTVQKCLHDHLRYSHVVLKTTLDSTRSGPNVEILMYEVVKA